MPLFAADKRHLKRRVWSPRVKRPEHHVKSITKRSRNARSEAFSWQRTVTKCGTTSCRRRQKNFAPTPRSVNRITLGGRHLQTVAGFPHRDDPFGPSRSGQGLTRLGNFAPMRAEHEAFQRIGVGLAEREEGEKRAAVIERAFE